MAATTFESNTLLLVNVADGKDSDTQYYVHIRYTDDPEQGPLVDTPAAYIGIYVGPEETPPDDLSLYKWSKYGGESSYIDIRYSNDGGKTLTQDDEGENNGKKTGSWMGVYVTDDSIVLDETWYPGKKNDEGNLISDINLEQYTWTAIQNVGTLTSNFFLETNYKSVFKFLSQDEEKNLFFHYSPDSLKITVKQRLGNETSIASSAAIEMFIYYKEGNDIINEQINNGQVLGNIELDLNDSNWSNKNIENIVIKVYYNSDEVLTEIVNVVYGTSEEMAKLSLNATDITMSINEAGLRFSSEGLEIKNGSLTLYTGNNKVFYADDKTGDVYFSGVLKGSKGDIGGWSIEKDSLEARDGSTIAYSGKVGLYSGKELFANLEDETSSDPLRIWAGRNNKYNYNFAVTRSGILYADKAKIEGKIVATEGYIKNSFFVGKDSSGIILSSGGENGQSFIGSALYSSGSLGYGWRLLEDGSAEFNNITARGKITSSVFEYDKISSIGGNLYIAPTIYLESKSNIIDKLNTSEYTVTWPMIYESLNSINGKTWEVGSLVKIDGEIITSQEILQLSGIDGTIIESEKSTISIKFNYQTDISGYEFQPGVILILQGISGRRQGLYLSAQDTGSPYLDVYDSNINVSSQPMVRLGNLSGIVDNQFSKDALEGYGLYSSNAYLTGKLVLPGAGITNQKEVLYNNSPIRIWAGTEQNSMNEAKFIVTEDGSLYASQGIFSGIVKATNSEFSGNIRAAGILLERQKNTANNLQYDHFYVAYSILASVEFFRKEISTETEYNAFKDKTDSQKKEILKNCGFTLAQQSEILQNLIASSTYSDFIIFLDQWEDDNFQPSSFNYVLNIDAKGLSIWEGGLKAYSDYASGVNNVNYINSIYGGNEPIPYFYLVDSGNKNNLEARIVATKGHFLTISEPKNSKYETKSIILNNGIWFNNKQYSVNDIKLENIESTLYDGYEKVGIYLENNLLKIIDKEGVQINSDKTIYLNAEESDIKANRAESVYIKGELNIAPKEGEQSLLTLNEVVIKGITKQGVNIGFDFIVS